MSAPEVPPSRLLALPAELRLQIFRLVLTSPESQEFRRGCVVVDVVIGRNGFGGSAYWGTRAMAHLFCVNKQVLNEAEAILYAGSIFRFAPNLELKLLKTWLGRLSDRVKKDLIKSVIPIFSLKYKGGKSCSLETVETQVVEVRERCKLLATELSKLRTVAVEIIFEGRILSKLEHKVIAEWIVDSTDVLKPCGMGLKFYPSPKNDSNSKRIFDLCRKRMLADTRVDSL